MTTHLQQSFHGLVIPYCCMNHWFKRHVSDSHISTTLHKKLDHGARAIICRSKQRWAALIIFRIQDRSLDFLWNWLRRWQLEIDRVETNGSLTRLFVPVKNLSLASETFQKLASNSLSIAVEFKKASEESVGRDETSHQIYPHELLFTIIAQLLLIRHERS